MEQSNGKPEKALKITDKILIEFFKKRNNVVTNAERLNRIIPNYNRIFNRNIPNNADGVTELRNILTEDFKQSLTSINAEPIPKVKQPKTKQPKTKQPKLTKQQKDEIQKKQDEAIAEFNKQQLQKTRDELFNTFRYVIKTDVDVMINFSFAEITLLYQYSIRDFIDLLLDFNPHTEALPDRIVILSVFAPNDTTPEHIFLLSRTGVFNLYEFLRGNNQYSKDSSEKMESLFQNFTEGYTFILENKQIIKRRQKIAKEGEFFNYLQKTDIDLSICGIFNNKQNEEILDEGIEKYRFDLLSNKGCLYYALYQNLELDHQTPYIIEDLNYVFTDIHRTSLKIATAEKIAIDLKICIHLRFNDGLKNRVVKLNDKETYIVKIGFLADHYFLDFKLNFTMFSLVNYFDICNEKDFGYIYRKHSKGGYARDNTSKKFITAYDAVELFLKNKELFLEDLPSIIEKSNEDTNKQFKATAITEAELINAISKIEPDQIYNYIEDLEDRTDKLQKRLLKDKNLNVEWIEVSCDLETITNQESNKIIAIQSNYKLPNEPAKGYIGLDCIVKLLSGLPNNSVLYFHNTKFDISHFQGYFTEILEYVENEGRFIYQKAKYYKKTLYIIDTMNYLSGSLASLADDFKLKRGKELINHQIYNEVTKTELDAGRWFRNVNDDYVKYYNKDDEFLENIDKWRLRGKTNTEVYNALGYLYEYGLVDVIILQQLYNIITKSIFDNFGINMKFSKENGFKLYPTISSVAREFSKKSGCLENTCSNRGFIREFIDGALVGGKTMLKNNEKIIVNNSSQSIIDYTSLYPSAMFRMGRYPIGKPSLIKSLDSIGENYYVVKIRIGKGLIRRPLHYPVISKINKRFQIDIDGKLKNINTRCFTNDFKVGEELIIDKYTLEDAVEFQGLDFQIVYGLCWLDGYNTTIKEVVKMCFEKRIELKKAGNNAGQTSYKLILNSLYGFTAEKPHLTKLNIVTSDLVMNYVLTHSKRVCSASKIIGGNKYLVKSSEDINKHFNYNHIATSILSYSKRLMSEVFVIAEENLIEIEYTDTDSLFLKTDDLGLLNDKYIEKYNRELINNAGVLNTFKVDMNDFVVRKGNNYFKTNSKELGISSEDLIGGEGIYLGKKTYLVEVKNKKDENFTGYIFSSKGITDSSLFYYCNKKQEETGVNYGLKELFIDLSKNEYIEIDLCEGGNKYRVEYINTSSFQKKNFTRRIGGFKEIEFN
jgi:hypothetical protein